ncbi:MAG: hypothetical protein LBL86_02090 [Coriobacteriales bacterium]|nr:hypothetical protein [Coriobacteriales bacterium]
MNEKLLISVYLPANGQTYDFWVPKAIGAYDATRLLAQLVESRAGHCFMDSPQVRLYRLPGGEPLEIDKPIFAVGLSPGARLMMV